MLFVVAAMLWGWLPLGWVGLVDCCFVCVCYFGLYMLGLFAGCLCCVVVGWVVGL